MKDNFKKEKKTLRKGVNYPVTDTIRLSFDGTEHNLSSAINSINKYSSDPYISFYFKHEVLPTKNSIFFKMNFLVREKIKEQKLSKEKIVSLLKNSTSLEVTNSKRECVIRIVKDRDPSFYCNIELLINFCKDCLLEVDQDESRATSYGFKSDYASELSNETRVILTEFIEKFSNFIFPSSEVNFIEFFTKNGPFTEENTFYDQESEEVIPYEQNIDQYQFLSILSENIKDQFGIYLFVNKYHSLLNKNNIHRLFPDEIGSLTSIFISTLEVISSNYNSKESNKKTVEMRLVNFKDIYYLPSVKGSNERSYRSKDEHILNVLFKEYINSYKEDKLIEDSEPKKDFYEKWFKCFGMETLSMERNDKLDANFYSVQGFSHVDLGYGMTQVIAIILRILSIAKSDYLSSYFNSHIIILEEPESNLHPKFQSLLGDLFVEAAETFNIQFIVETHSEYLIRRLQFLTAKKQIKSHESLIYYFHDPNNIPKGEKQVKKIEILEDGSLSDDFGPGFFDEAANLELELIRLKNRKNRNN